jgi:DNA/RNA-binding domain of Phe-tRNA-synthetase-like protein
MSFGYDPAVLARFPGVVGGVILARELSGGATPAELAAAFAEEQAAARARLGDMPLSEVPSLAVWRRAFSAFGVAPTQYRSAAEALLRRVTKGGDVPSINRLVDIGNLVSVRYALPVAIFDTRALHGGLTVRFARGDERFTNLGEQAAVAPDAGEVIFIDEAGLVAARRWCWRQSDEVAARDDTTAAIVTVEAHHAGGHADVVAALADLAALLRCYAGGDLVSGVVDADHPRLSRV